MSWASLLPYLPTYAWPPDIAAVLRRWSPDRLAETGGFSLWRTDDGVHWEPVTRDGFGNKFNWGGRTFASTPHGLFVGTANPFGPRLAMRSEEHTSELQSLMRISYAVFCLKKKKQTQTRNKTVYKT